MTSKPSLRDLQDRDRTERMEGHRASLEQRSQKYAIRGFKPGMDIWELARIVHEEEDRRKWPELEKRAAALGVQTHGLFGRRQYAAVSLDCYAAEEHQQLLKKYGYTT